MANTLKKYEEEITSSLQAADVLVLVEDMKECGFLSQTPDLTHMSHPLQLMYLVEQMYEVLKEDDSVFENCLNLLSRHGISDDFSHQLQLDYVSSKRYDSQVSHEAMVLAKGIHEELDGLSTTSQVRSEVKRKHTSETVDLTEGIYHEELAASTSSANDCGQVRSSAKRQCTHEGVILAGGTHEAISTTNFDNKSDRLKRKHTSDYFFTEGHVQILTEILHDCAFKWQEIGTSLLLPRYIIEATLKECTNQSLEMHLNRVLWEWVTRQYPHAKKPTREILRLALSSNLVGLGRVADDLEQRLEEHEVHLKDEEPPPFSKRKHLELIKAREGGAKSIQDRTNMSKWKKILTDVYSVEPEVPNFPDSWPPNIGETYIKLALIKQSNMTDSDEYSHSTIQGDMDNIYKGKESIDYNSVFSNLKSGSRLLIQGRPGSGKTTLVHKVSRDWANGCLKLETVQLLFLVHLRYLCSDPTVALRDIIKNHYTSDSTTDDIVKYAEEQVGKGYALFWMDWMNTTQRNKI